MHLMLDFSYNLDSVFSHELCKSAFSDGIFWDSGVEPHREWIRERREHMHNVLTWERDRYGARLVGLFYRYCKVANPFPRCTLNTRINYRAHAVNLPDWPARSLELNKMWLSWSEKK